MPIECPTFLRSLIIPFDGLSGRVEATCIAVNQRHHKTLRGETKQMAQHVIPVPDNAERIRVLAADSTRMSSQLLAESLAQDRQFEVTGIEPKGASILEAVAHKKPHVVLVSSVLEGSATLGFDLTRQLRSAHAEVRVVLPQRHQHAGGHRRRDHGR